MFFIPFQETKSSNNQNENKEKVILNIDEIQAFIEDDKNISEENFHTLCSSILENNLKLNQCLKLVTKYETPETIFKIVVPMLELDPEQDFDCLKVLNSSSQKIVLESLNNFKVSFYVKLISRNFS